MSPYAGKEENTGDNIGGLPVSSSFSEHFVALNRFDRNGFKEWLFTADMLFRAGDKWWGNKGQRTSPHEGTDLALYRTVDARNVWIQPGTKIPATFDGTVVGICGDFLGQSIFIKHSQYHQGPAVLVTAFGHTSPGTRINTGIKLREGDIVGTVADTGNRKNSVPSHLHVSVAWIPGNLSPGQFNWDTFTNPKIVTLVDPLPLLKLPYSIVKTTAISDCDSKERSDEESVSPE